MSELPLRVIYSYAISAEVVLLLTLYAKNEKEDLNHDQKKEINRFFEAYGASLREKHSRVEMIGGLQ